MTTTTYASEYSYQPKDSGRKVPGIALVVALHLLLAWAVVSGTAKKGLDIIKKPLQAVVIQEVIIPPPPPPPPPPKEIKPPEIKAPKVQAPPPPFVPKAEVTPPPAPTPAPVIAAVEAPPPAPVVIAPPPPPAPAPPAAPTRSDIGVACPTQEKPQMPVKAERDQIYGVVKAQVLIRDGVVREVTILSGPRVFHENVKKAMLQYKCVAGSGEVLATQEFVFKEQ